MRKTQAGVVLLALVMACAAGASAQTLYEDFEGGVLPAGWAVEDVDGLTPSDDGFWGTSSSWMIIAETASNYAAASTSWYTTGETANDWIITPQVTPVAGDLLTWDARAHSASYPDGYEVRYSTTTQTAAGCLANAALLVVAEENLAWTGHSVDIAAHVGVPTYYCFRNNSTNMWNLYLDNVRVGANIQYDLSLDSVTNPHQYGWFPTFLADDFTLVGNVTNDGPNVLTNVQMTVDVDYNGTPQTPIVSNTVASLASAASDVLTAADFTPGATGTYTVAYTAGMTETDDVPSNNTATRVHHVTDSYLSRSDWDSIAGSVGFGTPLGHFGTLFETGQELQVQGVDFVMQGLTEGTTYNAYIWSWDTGTGQPVTITATSDPFVRTAAEADYVYVEFPGGPVTVGAQFFVSVYEPTAVNMGMWYSDHVFTPNTVFYKIDGSTWTATTYNFALGVEFAPAVNTAPVVEITAPVDPSSVSQYDLVTFTGTANDLEDGDLTASLTWTSDLDGVIGTGATFGTTTLSVGVHVVTASVTDSGLLVGTDTVTVTVNADPDFIFADGFESGDYTLWSTNTP